MTQKFDKDDGLLKDEYFHHKLAINTTTELYFLEINIDAENVHQFTVSGSMLRFNMRNRGA